MDMVVSMVVVVVRHDDCIAKGELDERGRRIDKIAAAGACIERCVSDLQRKRQSRRVTSRSEEVGKKQKEDGEDKFYATRGRQRSCTASELNKTHDGARLGEEITGSRHSKGSFGWCYRTQPTGEGGTWHREMRRVVEDSVPLNSCVESLTATEGGCLSGGQIGVAEGRSG